MSTRPSDKLRNIEGRLQPSSGPIKPAGALIGSQSTTESLGRPPDVGGDPPVPSWTSNLRNNCQRPPSTHVQAC
ncbi:hypothetical protein CAAN1_32S00122 [[Candida] anglica]|uniref:Uncharacterized protein n=1 Tax=[Candida] anglica TaxID=148631 RepID=A0ABP0EEV6_9ASCO